MKVPKLVCHVLSILITAPISGTLSSQFSMTPLLPVKCTILSPEKLKILIPFLADQMHSTGTNPSPRNEWGCWTQGVKNSSTISEHISGKHTMFLILSHPVPSGRKQGHLCNFCMHHGCALAKLNHGKSA
jgi:hypothetical protein